MSLQGPSSHETVEPAFKTPYLMAKLFLDQKSLRKDLAKALSLIRSTPAQGASKNLLSCVATRRTCCTLVIVASGLIIQMIQGHSQVSVVCSITAFSDIRHHIFSFRGCFGISAFTEESINSARRPLEAYYFSTLLSPLQNVEP